VTLVRTATAADVPGRAASGRSMWGPKVQQSLDDPEVRFVMEPGEDFEPGGYEGLRKRIHGIAGQHKVKAHTRTLEDGSVAVWFYKPQ
jgi:hypothetical protein